MLKRILILSGFLFFAVGIHVLSNALRSNGEERSIDGAASIAILTSGRIAIGISHLQRVQFYSRDGEYLGAISVDSRSGGIRLKALANGGFQAATTRNRRLHTFDSEGMIESIEDDFDDYASFGGEGQWEARSGNGEIYRIQGPLIIRQVGASSQVIVDHRNRWLLESNPLFAVLLLVSGAGQLLIAVFWLERFRSMLARS